MKIVIDNRRRETLTVTDFRLSAIIGPSLFTRSLVLSIFKAFIDMHVYIFVLLIV
jgi:hypothetical protein